MTEETHTSSDTASERTTPPSVSAGAFSTSDGVDAKDTLGFEPYVQAAVNFLLSEKTRAPLTLSVEGAWGSGKSSFMRQMMRKLEDRQAKTVDFNAWRHDKDESLWAAFALALVEQLKRNMPWYSRGLASLRLLGLRYDRRAGMFPAIRYLLRLLLWITLASLPVWLWRLGYIKLPTIENINSLSAFLDVGLPFVLSSGGVAASVVALATTARQVVRTVGNPLRHDLRKYFKTTDYAARVAFVERFHEDLRKILDAYAGKEKVFVFIDDLDRCEVPRAADLMGAINLLIDVERSNLVFVLGLDREKVAAGLAVKFESVIPYVKRFDEVMDGNRGSADDERRLRRAGVEFGYEFLEKFIQLPIRVPVPQPSDVDRFLRSLNVGESPSGTEVREGPIARLVRAFTRLLAMETQAPSQPTGGPVEDSASAQPEDDQQRDWSFRLGDDRDSKDVLEIARIIVAPAMDYNPRRLIHFMNNFRLRAYTAYRTGLFNPRADDPSPPLRLEQLGKFVAIALRWPLFVYELEEDPGKLARLAAIAEGRPKEPNQVENIPDRWLACRPLLDLLAYGTKEDPDARFTMTNVDVGQLLRVSPAVVPRRAEGRLDEAEGRLRQAAKLEPRSGAIAKDLGDFLKSKGRTQEAIDEYIRAGSLYEEAGESSDLLKAIGIYQEALEHGAGKKLVKRIEQIEKQLKKPAEEFVKNYVQRPSE